MKTLPIKEAISLGLIQEINRTVLHPCGIALFVSIDDSGEATLGGFIDNREDPEGMIFSESYNIEKVKAFNKLYTAKHKTRTEKFGFHVQGQPIEGLEETFRKSWHQSNSSNIIKD